MKLKNIIAISLLSLFHFFIYSSERDLVIGKQKSLKSISLSFDERLKEYIREENFQIVEDMRTMLKRETPQNAPNFSLSYINLLVNLSFKHKTIPKKTPSLDEIDLKNLHAIHLLLKDPKKTQKDNKPLYNQFINRFTQQRRRNSIIKCDNATITTEDKTYQKIVAVASLTDFILPSASDISDIEESDIEKNEKLFGYKMRDGLENDHYKLIMNRAQVTQNKELERRLLRGEDIVIARNTDSIYFTQKNLKEYYHILASLVILNSQLDTSRQYVLTEKDIKNIHILDQYILSYNPDSTNEEPLEIRHIINNFQEKIIDTKEVLLLYTITNLEDSITSLIGLNSGQAISSSSPSILSSANTSTDYQPTCSSNSIIEQDALIQQPHFTLDTAYSLLLLTPAEKNELRKWFFHHPLTSEAKRRRSEDSTEDFDSLTRQEKIEKVLTHLNNVYPSQKKWYLINGSNHHLLVTTHTPIRLLHKLLEVSNYHEAMRIIKQIQNIKSMKKVSQSK